jgi:hypothetical protein
MFEIEALPDMIAHAQFKISATALPARARRLGLIDLSQLTFYERADLNAAFALILSVTMEPVEGIVARAPAMRSRLEADARQDVHSQLWIEIENTTDAPKDFAGAVVTIAGIARAVLDEVQVLVAAPALVNTPLEFATTTISDVPILARWAATFA